MGMVNQSYVFNGSNPEQTAELVRTLLSAHTFGGDISFTVENPRVEDVPYGAKGVCRDRYLSALGDQTYVHVDVHPQKGIDVLVGGVQLPHEDGHSEHFAQLSLPHSDRDAALVRQYIDAVYGPVLAAQKQEPTRSTYRPKHELLGLRRMVVGALVALAHKIPVKNDNPQYF
jgi:hypothetical protein